jgi:PTS system nitrogen regulatory IIA component
MSITTRKERTVRLTEYLTPDRIWTDITSGSKQEVIQELSQRISSIELEIDEEELCGKLLEREGIRSTGIGNRIAVPHAILSSLDKTELFVGVCQTGTEFDSADHQPVKLFMVLVGPETDRGAHLKLLARIFRLTHNASFVDDLVGCDNSDLLLARINGEEEQHV